MTEHDAWFDHAGLYDTVVHVPLIIWKPGLVPAGRHTTMVQHVDVMPTVLELAGLAPVDGLDGRSLVPLLRGETTTHRAEVMLSECTWQAKRAIRDARWKFIRCLDPGVYPRSEDELYDLEVDPTEQHNVAAAHPDVVADMHARLDGFLAEHLDGRPDPMETVVADGLPAVLRLRTIEEEARRAGEEAGTGAAATPTPARGGALVDR
jgi:arylsulfatase A-like enzyme